MFEFGPKVTGFQKSGFGGDDFFNWHTDYPDYQIIEGTEKKFICKRLAMEEPNIILDPGELVYTGKIMYCSFIAGSIGENIFPCHAYPFISQKLFYDFIANACKFRGYPIGQDELRDIIEWGGELPLFDNTIIISKQPNLHGNLFNRLSNNRTRFIGLGDPILKKEEFSVILANDVSRPGDLSNFNIHF